MAPPCTCAPHPRIDLTVPYLQYHGISTKGVAGSRADGEGENAIDNDDGGCVRDGVDVTAVRQQILEACRSHGCFHATLRLGGIADETSFTVDTKGGKAKPSSLPMRCLAKPREEIEDDIEALFTPSFLNGAVSPTLEQSDVAKYESSTTESSVSAVSTWQCICNGRTINVPPPNPLIAGATFRGRLAESGDEFQSNPEPKLSWEFQRCSISNSQYNTQCATSKNETTNTQSSTEENHQSTWNHLPNWTEALHSVASTIIYSLGIPPELVLQEQSCKCSSNQKSGIRSTNDKNGKGSESSNNVKCNSDLLRVFRYDALPTKSSTLGSSAHSDWGTLTVVWQDDKGGLQTYCHGCDIWSDVDDSCVSDSSSQTVHLFVHVGDFLSLATYNNRKERPEWSSPRHRVLCPVRSSSDSDNETTTTINGKECRRSLVYFAYPPPGISLNDAQRKISSSDISEGRPSSPKTAEARKEIITAIDSRFDKPRMTLEKTGENLSKLKEPTEEEWSKRKMDCDNDDVGTSATFFQQYSVLHNQSQQTDDTKSSNLLSVTERMELLESSARDTYQRMLKVPFGKVISDKWNQVQRK